MFGTWLLGCCYGIACRGLRLLRLACCAVLDATFGSAAVGLWFGDCCFCCSWFGLCVDFCYGLVLVGLLLGVLFVLGCCCVLPCFRGFDCGVLLLRGLCLCSDLGVWWVAFPVLLRCDWLL